MAVKTARASEGVWSLGQGILTFAYDDLEWCNQWVVCPGQLSELAAMCEKGRLRFTLDCGVFNIDESDRVALLELLVDDGDELYTGQTLRAEECTDCAGYGHRLFTFSSPVCSTCGGKGTR